MQIVSVIPQICYDVIVRLAPGSVIIGSAYVVIVGPGKALEGFRHLWGSSIDHWSPSFAALLIVLLGSYLISILLTGVWEWLHGKVKAYGWDGDAFMTCWSEAKAQVEAAGDPLRYPATEGESSPPDRHLMFDFVRFRDRDAGAQLLKLRAELRMYEVLAAGWFSLVVMHLFYILLSVSHLRYSPSYHNEMIGRLFGNAVLVGLVAAMLGLRSRLKHLYSISLCRHWLFLTNPNPR